MAGQLLPHHQKHDESHDQLLKSLRARDINNTLAMIGFFSPAVARLLGGARVVVTLAAAASPFLCITFLGQLL